MIPQQEARKIWADALRDKKYPCSPCLIDSENNLKLKIGNELAGACEN